MRTLFGIIGKSYSLRKAGFCGGGGGGTPGIARIGWAATALPRPAARRLQLGLYHP